MATPTDTTEQPVPALDEHLERLLAFEPTTLPVLSIYLNTQAGQNGRTADVAGWLGRELKTLARTWDAGTPERASFDADGEAALAYVADELDPASNGVALFTCSGAGLFEAVQTNAPLEENRVYVYNQPHLFHLTRIDEEYPRYAAVVTDANTARIYVFGLGQTLETEQVKGKKVHRVKVGGWSQARYQRRVGNAHQAHAKELVERLQAIVASDQATRILISGDATITAAIREELPKELAEMVVEGVKVDSKASEQDVFDATIEKMREIDAQSDIEKVNRMFEQYRGRGMAIAGPQPVLEALANGQVDELLISASLESQRPAQEPVEAILAPEIPDSGGGTDSDEPREASLPDLLVTKAKQTDARVTFIEDAKLLEPVEGVGAFLRWRAA